MRERKVRYIVEAAAPFAVHGEGLTIQAVTRKSEVPVTIEIEGVSRRLLLQFQEAIADALAHHVPPDVLSNDHYSRLGVDDAWIRERTGIRERRFARDGGTSDLIVPAARACLERAGLSPKDIDCVVVATMTPDRPTPPTS